MNTTSKLGGLLMAALALCLSSTANAAVPDGINYQAYLTNADGSPVNAPVTITFAAYAVDVGGVPLWNATESVSPENGLFTVTLGNPVNPFPAGLFDTPVFIGLFVAGEEMLPRRALKSAAYSFKAADADALNGMTANDLDQSDEVAALTGDLSSLQSTVQSNQIGLGQVANDVNTNDGRITANTNQIGANDGRISILEANPGDITGVTAGAGLVGGAGSGNATLAIATGGITAANMGANSVTTGAIQNGTIRGEDLDVNSDFEVRGLTTNSATIIGGELTIDSVFDIKILDDFHGLRWRSTDGNTAHGSITVRSSEIAIFDDVRARTMIESNVNGIGVGTANPATTHDVTIPSLLVTGNIDIGRERVATNYILSSTVPQCHSHGNLPCFYGSGSAVCPVGKKLLGGGSSGSTARFGSIATAAPGSDSTFTCAASYDIGDAARTCYAICARVD